MKRRKFIKKVGFAAGAPIAFQGVPIKLMAGTQMQKLAAQSTNDKVLIILQMHGGNDGLNTIVPLGDYSQYQYRRANIAIPYQSGNRTAIQLDSTVPAADQVGLHPDMQDFKTLYDNGMAAVFQGVSYENNNGSHFRGRDIWLMGGSSDDYFSSGWIGRFLKENYPGQQYPDDFPNDDMPDPLALEMGNDVSLLFHQTGNIPTSISLGSTPDAVERTIEQLEGFVDEGTDPRGTPPEFLNNSPYGREMEWILGLEDKSETYIKRLSEIYTRADETSVSYPERYPYSATNGSRNNNLSNQLRLVARLLGGGAQTKVFLVKIGGFDTHADQTETNDPTMGAHAALMYHISSAMRAFQEDLLDRGIADRVMTITMSEFGRRIASNGSYGTDHGTGGPLLMFGAGVKPGIFGTNPDLSLNNVSLQFDYRQIYASILHEWMGLEKSAITDNIFYRDFISGDDGNGGTYEPLNLVKDTITGADDNFLQSKYKIESLYPNPASTYVQVNILINDFQNVSFELINVEGRVVRQVQRSLPPGRHTVTFRLNQLLPGMYFVKAKSLKLDATKRLVIRK